jgi:Family of unknown function (DUF6325)
MHQIGPVQLLSIGFEPGANFEGEIVDELAKLERERTIRILDLLFIAKDPDSDEVVVLEHHGSESMGEIVGDLLGIEFSDEALSPAEADGGGSFGFSQAEIEQMATGLPRGGAAGLLLIEHVWARDLRRVIAEKGGHIIGEGFLTREAIASVEPKLVAMSERIEAQQDGA